MSKLLILVGPPGSGKSTIAHQLAASHDYIRISQDDQGKEGHKLSFVDAVNLGKNIVIDRMNFNKQQRKLYLDIAKSKEYETEIRVLHESKEVCLKRCVHRIGHHPTILTEQDAQNALNTFFSKYERPTEDEANHISFIYPEPSLKLTTIIVDLDGTLCQTDHRQHFMDKQKKDWKGFFDAMKDDLPNEWCNKIVNNFRHNTIITLCSGRPDNYKKTTSDWLQKYNVVYDNLFMRLRNDTRSDNIIKEIILDFEILTRYSVLFAIDDRKQVIDMWRNRGITVLDCAGERGHF